MLLSGPSRGPTIAKFLSQNAHCKTKSFTELVAKYFLKFEKEIDEYFPSLGKDGFANIRNPFTANAPMLQTETGTREELVKIQYDGFARDVYSKKFLIYHVQLIQKIATPAIRAFLLLPSSRLCKSTFLVLVEIKSK